MLKAYKYRIYPNKKQEELIQKTFGCCRFIYNNCLNKNIRQKIKDKRYIKYNSRSLLEILTKDPICLTYISTR